MAKVDGIEEAMYELEDCISPGQAHDLTGFSKTTIIDWCKKYKIGKQIGNRWFVHPKKLELLIRGELKRK